MKKEVHHRDIHKGDITFGKLIFYNILFLAPISISYFFSTWIAPKLIPFLHASPNIISDMIMIPLVMIIFLVIVPYIRTRENVKGVRQALIGFLIVGLFIALPSILVRRDFTLLFNQFIHLASYIVVTFIYTPEVLGIDEDLKNWFIHHKQLFILLIYASIVIFYVIGFGHLYFQLENDKHFPGAFTYSQEKPTSLGTFMYYSIVTFTTVGYGDISPVSTAARILFSVEALLSAIINIVFIAILLIYVSNSQIWAQEKEGSKMKKTEARIEREEREILKEEKEIKHRIHSKNKR